MDYKHNDMNDKDDFLKQMENLQVPGIDPPSNQKTVKMAIMNAERSATLGVWLIAVPCYFLLCVCMYYYFHVHISWFEAMFALMAGMDKSPWLNVLSPILFVILPIVSIVINTLSIIHVHHQKMGPGQQKIKEFSITIKVKIWNIVLLLVSLAIVWIFVANIIIENITIKK